MRRKKPNKQAIPMFLFDVFQPNWKENPGSEESISKITLLFYNLSEIKKQLFCCQIVEKISFFPVK